MCAREMLELDAGDDSGGIGVHIAARIQADADPGQVLVSSTVKDLVVGSGLRFGDRGERALKGVPGHVASVRGDWGRPPRTRRPARTGPSQRARIRFLLKSSALEFSDHWTRTPSVFGVEHDGIA